MHLHSIIYSGRYKHLDLHGYIYIYLCICKYIYDRYHDRNFIHAVPDYSGPIVAQCEAILVEIADLFMQYD